MKEVVWLKNCSGRCYKSLVTPRDHIGILNQNFDLGIKIFKKKIFLDRSVEYGWKYELCDVIGMWRNWSCNKYCDKLWRSCCFPNWYPLWNCLQHSISSWFRNGEILDSVIRLTFEWLPEFNSFRNDNIPNRFWFELNSISELGWESPSKERIYEIKGRSAFKPVALCFGQIEQITEYVPKCPVNLLRALLPGPVTLVIEREGSRIPDFINPTCPGYIGIRIPGNISKYFNSLWKTYLDDKLTQQLCSSAGPLCLTSANRSGGASAITPNDFAELHADLDHVIKRGTIQKNHLSR